MYTCNNNNISKIYSYDSASVNRLCKALKGKVNIYIDWANIKSNRKINGKIVPKTLFQFIQGLPGFNKAYFYHGFIQGDRFENFYKNTIPKIGYVGITKEVKVLRKNLYIDKTLGREAKLKHLSSFIRSAFLYDLADEDIDVLCDLCNKQSLKHPFISDKKCNFDVEMSVDIKLHEQKGIETFILFTSDSDFASVCKDLLGQGHNVIIISASGTISTELTSSGAYIFNINRIINFICSADTRSEEVQNILKKQ